MNTRTLLICIAAAAVLCGCELLDGTNGPGSAEDTLPATISLKFSDNYSAVKGGKVQIPDTNSFILSVINSSGECIYSGAYCDSPAKVTVTPDTYHIKVVSENFSAPSFDKPQWGDEQTVKVASGENCLIELMCRQMNCGVKIDIDEAFLTDYSSHSSLLLSATEGSLLYSYGEKRTAFFVPGTIKLILSSGATDKTLLSRSLGAGEILCLSLKVAGSGAASSENGMILQIDTTRVYLQEEYILGGSSSGKGSSPEDALTVGEVTTKVGKTDVWVGGYIVGGDLSTKGANYNAPFKANSNLLLGPRSSTVSREGCISVQLPSGSVRNALNLVDHAEYLGKYVFLKGNIESSYFGLVGLKNVTEYEFK